MAEKPQPVSPPSPPRGRQLGRSGTPPMSPNSGKTPLSPHSKHRRVPSGSIERTSTSPNPNKVQDRPYKDPLRDLHPSTAVIHAGYHNKKSSHAIKVPIFRSSTFDFDSAKEGAQFFSRAYHLPDDDGKPPGPIYSRLNNPNVEIFEDKMVSAEVGSNHAAAFPSGMSAISTVVMALVPCGSKILYSTPVYGGSYYFFKSALCSHDSPSQTATATAAALVNFHMCPGRLKIDSVGVDMSDLDQVEAVMAAEGPFALVWIETPANPTLQMTDIQGVDKLRARLNPDCIVAVDNTFMGPVFQKPFMWGADLVVYSATKYIGGHSDLLGGVALTKSAEHMAAIKDYRTILGPVIAPDTAWMLCRSLETVWLRMERQAEKAYKVAVLVADHPAVSEIHYPGCFRLGSKERALYERQCIGGGSMLSMQIIPPTREAAFVVLDNLKVCHLAVSLGGTETLVQHPRSMTHSDMSIEDLDATGIGEGMLRFSIGLESSDDIADDICSALDLLAGDGYSSFSSHHTSSNSTSTPSKARSDSMTEDITRMKKEVLEKEPTVLMQKQKAQELAAKIAGSAKSPSKLERMKSYLSKSAGSSAAVGPPSPKADK